MIFNNLDDQTLTKCKEVSREITSFLDNNTFYWVRVIKGIDKNLDRFGRFLDTEKEAWDIILNKTPIQIVKPMALAARESKLSSFHLEFSFNSIRYICLLFYCLVTFGFL